MAQSLNKTNKTSLLNEELITKNLQQRGLKEFNLKVFQTIDSTNEFLKNNLDTPLAICTAEEQTNGRGRFQRVWQSPFAENIYLSLKYTIEKSFENLNALSLIVSLSLIHTLKKNNVKNISIKWPNDLLFKNKKLCGCLIELVKNINTKNYEIIIGIGLNVNTSCIKEKWTSLFDITNKVFDRNQLISEIIINLHADYYKFLQYGFKVFKKRWATYDILYKQEIKVKILNEVISGIALGVNDSGELILLTSTGKEVYLTSGEASLNF